jgi:zinc transport system substrate-binding protein
MRPWITVVVAAVTVFSCRPAEEPAVTVDEPSSLLSVAVVNYPLGYFAERIGGELVDVYFPAPPEEDPAYWSPDAETIAAYQAADLILVNGAGYASWVDRATLPASRIVDTSAAFAGQYIPLEGTATHSHGPEGAHEHGGWAFTTWLDPTLAIEQARAVLEAFVKLRPEQTAAFRRGFAELVSDLSALDQRLAAAAETIGDEPLLFSHPVYQYLIGRYSLNARSVHWEPDQTPDYDELELLLEEQQLRWVVWEDEPLAETAARLDEYGVEYIVFDPCSNIPASGDFMTVMAANAEAFERIANDVRGGRQ